MNRRGIEFTFALIMQLLIMVVLILIAAYFVTKFIIGGVSPPDTSIITGK